MTENEENEALTALLAAARGGYDCAVRWKLSRAEVIALVRSLLAARPDLTVTELVQFAGKCGVPTSVLVRVGKGGPAAAPLREKASAWSRRPPIAPMTTMHSGCQRKAASDASSVSVSTFVWCSYFSNCVPAACNSASSLPRQNFKSAPCTLRISQRARQFSRCSAGAARRAASMPMW